jgi:hypothetical protein
VYVWKAEEGSRRTGAEHNRVNVALEACDSREYFLRFDIGDQKVREDDERNSSWTVVGQFFGTRECRVEVTGPEATGRRPETGEKAPLSGPGERLGRHESRRWLVERDDRDSFASAPACMCDVPNGGDRLVVPSRQRVVPTRLADARRFVGDECKQCVVLSAHSRIFQIEVGELIAPR